MVPIAGSCRAHCRMFSSCLICPAVPLSGSVRHPRRVIHPPAVASACLSLARLASLLLSRLVGRGGLAIGVGSVCNYGGRADVVRLLAPRFACVPFASCPAPSTRLAGRGAGAVVVGFLRISAVYRPR